MMKGKLFLGMKTIVLRPLFHRGHECIGIIFPPDQELNNQVKRIKGIKFSKTHSCWYLPMSRSSYDEVLCVLQEVATINHDDLKAYLTKKKLLIRVPEKPIEERLPSAPLKQKQINILANISVDNAAELKKFTDHLLLKSYSASTIKTYRSELMQLLQVLKQKSVLTLTAADMKRYMLYAIREQQISENTAHSRLNALKFYFEQVLRKEKFFLEIPRPKKQQQLPKLLNELEIKRLFNALSNRKHKAMLFTTYSAGLRVSEVVNLKLTDIDSQRMTIFIENSKGKKDRYVNLSPVLLDILRQYVKLYDPAPKLYLFESEQRGGQYPIRTVQQIFYNAKHKAGIKKEVGVHSLRHSFATHLLDKGTDIRYIKDLLGHFNIRTTERYLHVSKQQLVNIVSPFDDLWKNENIDW
jgi:site-specific recombinase XerD